MTARRVPKRTKPKTTAIELDESTYLECKLAKVIARLAIMADSDAQPSKSSELSDEKISPRKRRWKNDGQLD
ncbi:MAG: hypothetical protein JST89_06285 [Cyanobacteria bacterium SZAS-4]|nr:hypothetical protein [Cyanobacteria bacterium SZAS-4]